VFCQIVAGESPASIFYEDDVALAFMTIGPVTVGHALIIPKRHAAYLADLDEDTGCHLWTIAQRTAAAIRRSGLKCEGINLFLADGEAAGQEISHVHVHVFPRYRGDPFRAVRGQERAAIEGRTRPSGSTDRVGLLSIETGRSEGWRIAVATGGRRRSSCPIAGITVEPVCRAGWRAACRIAQCL
jgi:histidine triad (HIT) family protein